MKDPMELLGKMENILRRPTDLSKDELVRLCASASEGIHESAIPTRSYWIVEFVEELLGIGTPPEVVVMLLIYLKLSKQFPRPGRGEWGHQEQP